MDEKFSRTEMLIGNEGMEKLNITLCRKITMMHVFSVYSSLNLSKCEELKLLLKTIIAEVRKDPGLAIEKMEKLHKQIPRSNEGFRTKEELEKAGFVQHKN